MGKASAALAGAIALIVIVVVTAAIIATIGVYDVSADKPPAGFVTKAIVYVRNRSLDTRASSVKVPPLGRADMIADGASDYDEMCTGCHLAPGMKENEMRPGLAPEPPRLARPPSTDPRRQFWVIKHGIEMTAMPAWGKTHSDEEIWNIVAFLQKLPALSPERYRALVKQGGGHHEHEMGEHGEMQMAH